MRDDLAQWMTHGVQERRDLVEPQPRVKAVQPQARGDDDQDGEQRELGTVLHVHNRMLPRNRLNSSPRCRAATTAIGAHAATVPSRGPLVFVAMTPAARPAAVTPSTGAVATQTRRRPTSRFANAIARAVLTMPPRTIAAAAPTLPV